MSDKDKAPERIWIDWQEREFHLKPLAGYAEYVHADLVATKVKEAFKECIRWAKKVQSVKLNAAHDARADDEFAAMRLSHEADGALRVVDTLKAALERAAESGEGGDDG